jgi:NitT/TauT family transport system substrate-binding protein
MTRFFGLWTTFLLALLTATSAAAQPKEKVVLMLNWFVYGEHAPFFLGKERGYFEREGIDLQVQQGRGSAATIQAVGAGTVDLGYADVAVMMRAAARGAPVKSVGVLIQKSAAAVVSPVDRNIKTPKDLIGRTIAITPGDAVTPIWPLYLNKVGLDEKQIKTVSGDAQTKMNAVVNRQADGLLGFVTEQGARMPGIVNQQVNILRFADAGLNLVSLGVIARNDTIKSRSEVLKRFMRAATRSVEDAIKEPEAAIAAMMKAHPEAGVPDAQLASLKFSQQLYNTAESAGAKPFRVARKTIEESIAILTQYGGMEASQAGKPEDYYTLELLP